MANDFFIMVQRVGIFIILSQTLLHFRPNEEYEKYIKILCNIIILTMFVVPVLGLFKKDISDEFENQVIRYQKQMEQMEVPIEKGTQTSSVELNYKIEEEIKLRLNNIKLENYKITDVILEGMKEDGSFDKNKLHIKIVLNEENGTEGTIKIDKIHLGNETDVIEGNSNTEKYREKFADILGISVDYVEVAVHG